eukprot:3350868-Pyramimonas_sp.AAC.1
MPMRYQPRTRRRNIAYRLTKTPSIPITRLPGHHDSIYRRGLHPHMRHAPDYAAVGLHPHLLSLERRKVLRLGEAVPR